MKTNKLAVILSHFGQYSEVFLLQLFKALQQHGEINLYVLGKIDKANPWFREFRIKRLPHPISLPFGIYALRKLGKGLSKEALRKQYYEYLFHYIPERDIYFPFLSMSRSFQNAILSNKEKSVFTSVRGTDITVTPYLQPDVIDIYKSYASNIYKIHFLSEELKMRTEGLGIYFSKDQVIYQGVDLGLFQFNNSLPTDKLRILTIGRLHYVKGMEFAVFAASELKKRGINFELNILGDGPEKDKLKFLIHDLNLSQEVFLRGGKSRREVVDYFRWSNVYIHTHLVTGLSNTILEAIASNLRVLVFDSNLNTYQTADFTGLINEIPRYNYFEMADLLEEIWNSKAFGLPTKAVDAVLSQFSLENQAEKFVEFFEWN